MLHDYALHCKLADYVYKPAEEFMAQIKREFNLSSEFREKIRKKAIYNGTVQVAEKEQV